MIQPTLGLIIPIYYEQDNIIPLLKEIETSIRMPVKIYFIYDSNDDPTIHKINQTKNNYKYPIHLAKNKFGLGALNAIKTGIKLLTEDACVVVMADRSDEISKINEMFRLYQCGYDIICGSRYMKNGKQIGGNFIKKTLSKLAGKSLNMLTNIPVVDITNNFKLYSREIFTKIEIES